jgi:hypothetical protein
MGEFQHYAHLNLNAYGELVYFIKHEMSPGTKFGKNRVVNVCVHKLKTMPVIVSTSNKVHT